MRCLNFFKSSPPPAPPPPPPPDADRAPPPRPASSAAASDNDDGSPRSGRSGGHSSSAQASPTTFNLLAREYTLAVQTQSYNEIWAKIHHPPPPPTGGEDGAEEDALRRHHQQQQVPSAHLIADVLRPDRDSIQEALSHARPGRLTRLVSDYFDSSEHTSRLCLLLHRSVDRARAIYAPLHDVLDILPITATTTTTGSPSSSSQQHQQHQSHQHLSQSQCEWAFHTFQEFDRLDNPFPAPGSEGGGFREMRSCFVQLRQQLDRRVRKARARVGLFRHATHGSALCLVGSVVGITVLGLVIATHALAALVATAAPAGPLLALVRHPGDLFATRRRRLLEHIAQLDAAARGTFVLNNDLDTIERLVARLHATVESDKVLVRLGLARGREDRYPIEEVVRQLRRNHRGFLDQLRDLEEHVCLCFAAVNRARSLLLQEIHHHCHPHRHRRDNRATTIFGY